MPSRTKKDPDGWIIRESWDASSGERRNTYLFKRKRALRVEIKSKLAQQLAAYTLIEKDLRNVIVWLQEIEKLYLAVGRPLGFHVGSDREVFNLVKGLYVAALTFYGKCFTSCEGRKVKLEKKMFDESYHKIHDEVMHMRHNFAAHSGADNFEEVKIAVVFHPKQKGQFRIYRELQQPDFVGSRDEERTFASLAEHVREKVWEKIRKVEKAIYEREIEPEGFEYWHRRGR